MAIYDNSAKSLARLLNLNETDTDAYQQAFQDYFAFLTLAFILLHTCWGVIFFDALDRKIYQRVALVVISHLFISCLTLFNQDSGAGNSTIYLASLVPAYACLVVMGAIAFFTAGGSLVNVKAAFVCRKGRYDID